MADYNYQPSSDSYDANKCLTRIAEYTSASVTVTEELHAVIKIDGTPTADELKDIDQAMSSLGYQRT